jgi:hypothetical protein
MYKLKVKYEISSYYRFYSHDTLKPHGLANCDVKLLVDVMAYIVALHIVKTLTKLLKSC